ncbi:TFIIH/NER complex subunit TFB4 [Sporobolomyces koalae]|uniref:TFIIH/NER complex subunit TFB4 n=1 Tax=Sporobolomyces koalae TaxID=500713 RepID=UPI00316EFFF5
MTSTVTGDLLCLIVDLNPAIWATSTSLQLDHALDHILVFANSHLALRHENEIALFAATPHLAYLLYSSHLPPPPQSSLDRDDDFNMYQSFRIVDRAVVSQVKQLVNDSSPTTDDSTPRGVNLVGALSMALCHINRLSLSSAITSTTPSNAANAAAQPAQSGRVQPRILILSVTPDEPSQYVPIMNCIFTAQKSGISIDCLKMIGSHDSTFLQQATHLTSGTYYKLPSLPTAQTRHSRALLQYLVSNFLSGPVATKHWHRARQDQVDLRAACFCHRKIVDLGYVCSVCLSIFCSPLPVCTTCRTKFPMSTLKRLGFGAKPKPKPKPKVSRPPSNASATAPESTKKRKIGGDASSGQDTTLIATPPPPHPPA